MIISTIEFVVMEFICYATNCAMHCVQSCFLKTSLLSYMKRILSDVLLFGMFMFANTELQNRMFG
jgi:hypothetical protein